MTPLGQEIVLRAIGTALAGLSIAFAGYMLAQGGETVRVNGIEHLAIFAQPRGTTAAATGLVLPSLTEVDPAVDLTAIASVSSAYQPAAPPRSVEIIGARADRVWLRVDGAIRAAAPGDDVPRVGHIASIVPRDGGWVLLDEKGATLLSVAKQSNGASLFARKRIFE